MSFPKSRTVNLLCRLTLKFPNLYIKDNEILLESGIMCIFRFTLKDSSALSLLEDHFNKESKYENIFHVCSFFVLIFVLLQKPRAKKTIFLSWMLF